MFPQKVGRQKVSSGLIEEPGQADTSSRPPREIWLLGVFLNSVKGEQESCQCFALLCSLSASPIPPLVFLLAGSLE